MIQGLPPLVTLGQQLMKGGHSHCSQIAIQLEHCSTEIDIPRRHHVEMEKHLRLPAQRGMEMKPVQRERKTASTCVWIARYRGAHYEAENDVRRLHEKSMYVVKNPRSRNAVAMNPRSGF